MNDDQIRKAKADALFEFQQKFQDWRTCEIKMSGREMKAYIKAVMSGTEYTKPSTERASA